MIRTLLLSFYSHIDYQVLLKEASLPLSGEQTSTSANAHRVHVYLSVFIIRSIIISVQTKHVLFEQEPFVKILSSPPLISHSFSLFLSYDEFVVC